MSMSDGESDGRAVVVRAVVVVGGWLVVVGGGVVVVVGVVVGGTVVVVVWVGVVVGVGPTRNDATAVATFPERSSATTSTV
jgi:hypothetical protein